MGQKKTPGVDLNSLSLHCPPVSAIQLNEVIIESDTNTHWIQFTVVFHHLESVTNQENTSQQVIPFRDA